MFAELQRQYLQGVALGATAAIAIASVGIAAKDVLQQIAHYGGKAVKTLNNKVQTAYAERGITPKFIQGKLQYGDYDKASMARVNYHLSASIRTLEQELKKMVLISTPYKSNTTRKQQG